MMGSPSRWRGRVLVLAGLAMGCGGGGEGPGIVNAPVVVSVTVGQPSVNPLDIGGTVQLSATVEVQNGASQAVEWSSSAPNVATVNQSGLVTAVAGGQATITATSTANRSRSGSVSVTVNPPRVVAVTLNTGARTIGVGATFALAASVETRGTLPTTVVIASSNIAVATVAATGGAAANLVGVSVGQATITATSTADPTKSVSVQITVTGTVRITNVTPSPVSIRVNAQVKLTPTVQADAGVSSAVTFQSQNAAVATVAADGTVTGVALGQTNVIVRAVADASQQVTVPVTVRSGVTSVTLTPELDSVRPTATRQLTLSVVTEAGVPATVTLSSANPAVVTIDATARVTGVVPGQAFVRAVSNVDPTVRDSTLIIVADPCALLTTITLGTTFNGSITDASCQKMNEPFTYTVNTQTVLTIAATVQFAANFTFVGGSTGSYFIPGIAAGTTGTGFALIAAGRYTGNVAAVNASDRGSFSIATSTTNSINGFCGIIATTGVTVTLPLNTCTPVPVGRPAGTYRSYSFGLLPFVQTGERVTVTVTATGFIPLIELRHGGLPPLSIDGNGTNTAIQSYVAPSGGFVNFFVTSRDPGQSGTFTVKIEGPAARALEVSADGQAARNGFRPPASPFNSPR